MPIRTIPKEKTIALVAHDSRKEDLKDWVKSNADKLRAFNIVATGTTGKIVEETLHRSVKTLLSGPYGGDQQLGAGIAEGDINMIIFFWDALEQQAHDNDVKALQRLAVLWNIPMACNRATADYLFTSELMNVDHQVEVPHID